MFGPCNHGETAAIRDAGWIDFSRVVIGDVTNASGTEPLLRDKGVQVDILEDPKGIEFYARFQSERPELDLEDWRGPSAARSDG